jgi:hypothetical protein
MGRWARRWESQPNFGIGDDNVMAADVTIACGAMSYAAGRPRRCCPRTPARAERCRNFVRSCYASDQCSACFPRQCERQIEFHPIVHDFRRDAAPLASFEADQAIPFHGPQCTRQIGLGLSGDPGQFFE